MLALTASDARADTIKVRPGENAIQRAVNRADRGDRLLVKDGTYREDVVIDKRLKLVGARGGRPVISARCDSDITIDVTHGGVTLRHLKVKGAAAVGGVGYTVNLIGIRSGRLDDLVLKETCNGNPAYYGVNVFGTGALEITALRTFGGFVDAGIYVGGIEDTNGKTLRIVGNESHGNNVGILIEDSFGPQGKVLVKRNLVHHNDFGSLSEPAGILVRRSDRGRYLDNRARRNGTYGIHLDPDSDQNVLRGNRARSNPDNFLDEGTGNCGSGNSFAIPPC